MAYTKQTWNTGDIITAEKLNHIEDGVDSNAIMFINSLEHSSITATWQQVSDALENGKIVFAITHNSGGGYTTTTYYMILQTRSGEGNYYADAIRMNLLDGSVSSVLLYAESADGLLDFD